MKPNIFWDNLGAVEEGVEQFWYHSGEGGLEKHRLEKQVVPKEYIYVEEGDFISKPLYTTRRYDLRTHFSFSTGGNCDMTPLTCVESNTQLA